MRVVSSNIRKRTVISGLQSPALNFNPRVQNFLPSCETSQQENHHGSESTEAVRGRALGFSQRLIGEIQVLLNYLFGKRIWHITMTDAYEWQTRQNM